jgi:hypothetical protein
LKLLKQEHLDVRTFLVININKSADLCSNYYEATRRVWGIDPKRAAKCDYVLAERNQRIVGVFEPISEWKAVPGAEAARSRGLENTDRQCWGYEGRAAPPEIVDLCMGRKVPRARGDRSPFRYLTEDDLR